MEKEQDNSPEAMLARFRQGYKQDLRIKIRGLEVPCRILSAREQVTAISNAKMNLKVPTGHARDLLESIDVQIAVLKAGCTVGGIPYLNDRLLDVLSDQELGHLYDVYQSEVKLVDPQFESLSVDQISTMIDDVKKKTTTAKDYYTWQLAAIGKYCLDQILAKDNELG